MSESICSKSRAIAAGAPVIGPGGRRWTRTWAVLFGTVVGLWAGIWRDMTTRAPMVRAEALAALPIRSAAMEKTSQQMSASTAKLAPTMLGSSAGVAADKRLGTTGACRFGMQFVEGDYCPTLEHRCVEPFSDGSGRCSRFASAPPCQAKTIRLRYCIDEYEYPNISGEKPLVMVTFSEAKAMCEREGKRLCTAREWTLACEGPEHWPYPHGFRREAGVCNVDQAHRFPDVDALNRPSTRARELERLDQRTPSGAMRRCVSQFGVFDLVGNVDEWVVPDGPEPAAGFLAQTALKGGYFGPVRARCRPSTPTHGPTFKFYQVGFRCCQDAPQATRKPVGELADVMPRVAEKP